MSEILDKLNNRPSIEKMRQRCRQLRWVSFILSLVTLFAIAGMFGEPQAWMAVFPGGVMVCITWGILLSNGIESRMREFVYWQTAGRESIRAMSGIGLTFNKQQEKDQAR